MDEANFYIVVHKNAMCHSSGKHRQQRSVGTCYFLGPGPGTSGGTKAAIPFHNFDKYYQGEMGPFTDVKNISWYVFRQETSKRFLSKKAHLAR